MAQRSNGSKLTTREVTIQTVDISVQAMRIGPKQVTLALFRQLVHAEVFDLESGLWNGQPWGWVHYHWDGCGMNWQAWNAGYAKHIVWQDGELLKRDTVHRFSRYIFGIDTPGVPAEVWEYVCTLPQLYIAV